MKLINDFAASLKKDAPAVTFAKVKQRVRRALVPRSLSDLWRVYRNTRPLAERTCPCCGFEGTFGLFGSPPRIDAQCPKCFSVERHRLFQIAFDRGLLGKDGHIAEPVLHFAAERILEKLLRANLSHYETADLYVGADLKLNIEAIDKEDLSYGTVIANHVLEHVDDQAAFAEIFRILRPGGQFIVSVPMIEGWARTYEKEGIETESDRALHFGQFDHVRYYGSDFRDRVQSAGFRAPLEITAEGDDVIKFSLTRGEKVFLFEKPE